VIGHHNTIGDHNLIAPGVMTSGTVNIGNSCIVPAGTLFKNRVNVGDRVIVPVGYSVIQDIPSDTVIKERLAGNS
jgi:UDP-3-O-[3-hydroxymyristoyl] glucosamine N-acyltransferase